MSFLQLVLSLDKTKDGFNSILPIVSFISQQELSHFPILSSRDLKLPDQHLVVSSAVSEIRSQW